MDLNKAVCFWKYVGELPIASALAVAALDNTLLVIFIPTESSSFSLDLLLNFKSTLVIIFIAHRLETLHYLNKSNLFEDQRKSWEINKLTGTIIVLFLFLQELLMG